MQAPAGPLQHATLIVHALEPLVQTYGALGLVQLGAASRIGAAQASAWGVPALAGRVWVALGTVAGAAPLLRVIELPGATPRPTRFHHGWLALELLVRDVDALAARLPSHGFEVVGPPADLDLSPAIRAMQLVGPAGEMLYLTQVKAAVPPFEIPLSATLAPGQDLGPLFIAVLSTPAREATLAACAGLAPAQVLRFDTKVTVLNRALGHDAKHRWPVATAQLAGQCLFEIDEVVDAAVTASPLVLGTPLPAGLAWVALTTPGYPAPGRLFSLAPGAWCEPLPAAG